MEPWERALRDGIGDEGVVTDADRRAGYQTDWTGRWSGPCSAVVRPRSTAEVARVIGACAEHGVAVVPQGGNTGLVGGSVPRAARDADGAPPTIVLSTRLLGRLGPVDLASRQVTAGAGVTLTGWRDHARAAGLDAGVDFAARDSATIGGAIATNAGGSRVVRFGTMRHQLVGIEAVLADGTTVGSLAGLPKETAGLHWPSVICGSEGTLAVITAARLRLVPWFTEVATAMVTVDRPADAVVLLAELRAGLPALDAVEMISPVAIDLVAEHLGAPPPVGPVPRGMVVLVDVAARTDPTDELVAVLESSAVVRQTAVATDAGRRAHLLAFRDRIPETVNAVASSNGVPPFKLDVAVPVDRLDALLETAQRAAARDGCRLVAFGHLPEGNLHLNHLGVHDPDRLAEEVLTVVADLGGTISAEHGIGIAKRRWLPLVRTPGELAAQRAIRDALDPAGILNPGVLDPTIGRQVP